jgi:uncharacterized membrane protein
MRDRFSKPSVGERWERSTTFAISWFMTGRVVIAGSIAGIEVVTKIAWYYLHERVWADIQWGRRR